MKRSTSPKTKSRSTSPDIRRIKRKLNHSPAITTNKSTITVSTSPLDMKNHDVCDSCGGVGQFLCCDACPNAFHFTCVEPPMDSTDVANLKEKWYCTECEVKQNKKKKNKSNPRGLFHKLIDDISTKNPKAFKLPNDIVHFFKGVSSDKLGRYIDTTQVKQVKYKNGEIEHPDYYQLKDKNGKYRICYYCRKSALKKPMIPCDYCSLYWHLDCLTPPLASAPNPAKKWRCPNHIEHIIKPPREQRNPEKLIINNENKIPSSSYRHHLSHIIEKELYVIEKDKKKSQHVDNHHHQKINMMENIITSKNGVVYRVPVNPIKPDFANYVKKISKNNIVDTRRSSIPSTTASSSSSSEVNTPPLFNLQITSQKQQEPITTTNTNNDEEVEAWLQNMACFQAGGQQQLPTEQEDHILSLIRTAKATTAETTTTRNEEQEEVTKRINYETFEKYQKIEQLLRQKDEQEILKLLNRKSQV